MTTRAQVAVLRTTPETVLDDYDRLIGLAGVERYLPADQTVILKEQHLLALPFPQRQHHTLAAGGYLTGPGPARL